ncbi:MAG TPA: lysine-2,3-aminomutase-like protein [Pseudolabrys sp.]|nr:lysine-2,3-aminomutase-like protein [Pseudolabrys sp.]
MKTLRTPEDLRNAGLIPPERAAALENVAARYAVAIPPALVALIDRNDPNDPIARQFVPDASELDMRPNENVDPIGDHAHSPVEGIVHRYPDRVLFKLTHVCAVYCRFCFRREMVGPNHPNALSAEARRRAFDYIAAHPEIWEVILTGGDPLVASARRLSETLRALAGIDHVRVLRIHTRVPIAAPETITPSLVRALKVKGKPTYVAVHVNHPRELGREQRAAIALLANAGLPLVSQTVLLKGVNDSLDTLEALMRALVECRIKPYYVHHADLAPGTAHLRTDVATGQALMRGLRGRVSGLCQPEYVLDIPGGYGKAPVGPAYLVRADDTHVTVTDFTGRAHIYPPDDQ